ncbi:MAG: hypothetical protein R3B82_27615 [Sandaracinaceae bacterium]
MEEKKQEQHRRTGPIVDAHGGPDFLVVDATGAARVDTRVVTPELDRDRRFVSGILKEPPPELKAFLASRGHETTGLVFNKTLRYYEGVVEVGEEVAVVGKVTMEDVPDEASKGESYRDAGRKRPALRGPVLLSDEPAATKP